MPVYIKNLYLPKILIFIIFSAILCFICVHFDLNFKKMRYSFKNCCTASQENTMKLVETKIILYWDSFYGKKDFGFGVGSKVFKNCEVQACYTTSNKSFLPVDQFDAILFHGARYSVAKNGIPQKRSPHQKYVFYSMESFYNTHFEVATNNNFYNWTMTFKRDSDIFQPYGRFIRKETKYMSPSIKDLRNRKRQVAWFVSNCYTAGTKRRQRYVKELQKYIPVDIYGRCGKFNCINSEKCYEMLQQNYKFYISFENSLCEDYVTEKVYNVLKYNVVPIVFSFVDYRSLFPQRTLINANDFISPKYLAEYLWNLDGNETEYLLFLEWKKKYVVENNNNLCELCKKLHEPIKYSNYADIKDWYFGYSCVQ